MNKNTMSDEETIRIMEEYDLDEDDAEKYISLFIPYNFAVFLLIFGLITVIYFRYKIEILNLIGQSIYRIYINKKATINISAFAKGIYILKLSSDKETVVRKFVKE